MAITNIYQLYKRYRTLQTHRITALPLVILMPHSACNCRCVMCDIWKGNQHAQQLKEDDIKGLLDTFKACGTKQVLMSGGEALLNPNFFRFCEMLKKEGMSISLLSAGLTLKRHANQIADLTNELIISLDGNEELHNSIRNVPDAFKKLADGITVIRAIRPAYRITGRTVIHRLNFRQWPAIIETAKSIGLQQISFLPADVSSQAFNREQIWGAERQEELLLNHTELEDMKEVIEKLCMQHQHDFMDRYIAETPVKIQKIYQYYAACLGLQNFPYKKCNAPWVSTVVEADGTVRPCFFQPVIGNIRRNPLGTILNNHEAVAFRKNLDMDADEICRKCVCYLNLSPFSNVN